MKIDWIKYDRKDHVIAWFLCEAMAHHGIERFGDFDSTELDVRITVNGVEVPIKDTFDFLQSQLKALENKGVAEGYNRAVFDLQVKMDDWLEELKNDY